MSGPIEHDHSLTGEFYRELKRPVADCGDESVNHSTPTPRRNIWGPPRIDLTERTLRLWRPFQRFSHASEHNNPHPAQAAPEETPVFES